MSGLGDPGLVCNDRIAGISELRALKGGCVDSKIGFTGSRSLHTRANAVPRGGYDSSLYLKFPLECVSSRLFFQDQADMDYGIMRHQVM